MTKPKTAGPELWKPERVPACPFELDEFPGVARGWHYAASVVLGDIPAGEFVILACKRFFRDIERGKWQFRPALAERAIVFGELLPNIKGPLAGKPMSLLDWQAFIWANVFGFTDDKGNRRFRQGVVYVPRGNGKTTVAAPLAAYMCFVEGEGGAEGYAAAVTSDQARILFSTMQEMVRRTPQLKARFGVEVGANAIYQASTASNFKPVASDAKSLDGLNVHVGVCDEIGSHKTSEVYDVLLTALGKRAQPFLLSISTATGNTTGVGRQLWSYVERILRNQINDDRMFGILYCADAEDDPWKVETWQKANPSWGVAVQPDAIAAIAQQAQQSPAREAAFKTRHLNIWVGADDALFSMSQWERLAVPGLSIDDFEGRDCYLGLDLATKTDLAALAYLFPPREGVQEPYTVFSRCYLPELAVSDGRNPAYNEWKSTGELVVTAGDITDFTAIEDEIAEANRRFRVRACAFDPWASTQLAQRMTAEGVEMVEFRATTANFSEPTKELDALIRGKRIAHDGNGPLAWCMSNVVGHFDARGNVYPRKERVENKIDAAIAAIMALGKCMFDEGEGASVYEERGLLLL
jgi:phage terminase large subunit-like protein